jgi:hypothetical protein
LTLGFSSLVFFFLGGVWLFFEVNQTIRLPILDQEDWDSGFRNALLGLAGATLLIPVFFLIDTFYAARILREKRIRKKIRSRYDPEFASFDDLPELVSFGRRLIGDSHIDLETLQARFNKNNKIATCIFSGKEMPENRTLIGYYMIYPLTLEAYKRIHGLEILTGKGLREEHLSESFYDAAALYIGMAGALEGHAEGYVIDEMLNQIGSILHSGELRAICARPATEKGKSVMLKFGFQPLASPSEIFCLPLHEELLNSPRIKKRLSYR